MDFSPIENETRQITLSKSSDLKFNKSFKYILFLTKTSIKCDILIMLRNVCKSSCILSRSLFPLKNYIK